MYIIAIAWGFVVVLMAAAEAMSVSVIGGLMTLLFYGVLPMALFFWLLGTPHRARVRARRAAQDAANTRDDATDARDPDVRPVDERAPGQPPDTAPALPSDTSPANRPVVPSRRNE